MPSRFIDSVPFANDLVLLLGAFWDQQAQAPRLLGHEILDASNGLYRVFLGNPFLLMAAVTFVYRCLKGTYSLMEWIYGKIVDMFTVSIRIMDDEEIYDRVSDYVARYELMKESRLLRHADAKAKSKEPEKRWFSMHDDDTPPLLPELTLVPRMEVDLYIKHKGQVLRVYRGVAKGDQGTSSTGGGLADMSIRDFSKLVNNEQRCWIISMYGGTVTQIRDTVQEWVTEMCYLDAHKLSIYMCVRQFSEYSWKRIGNKELRSFESIVLRKGLKERILNDVQKFLNSKESYELRGIPYRHAAILYGPPGTGKTSYIKGLAKKLRKNLASISLTSSLDDESFLLMMMRVPANSIIVIEDFDRSPIAKDYEEEDDDDDDDDKRRRSRRRHLSGYVSEAGLLNALDGINTPEGSLVFLTCNNLDKIGAAVRRHGRVDHIYYFSYADEYQVEEMFWRFFGKGPETLEPKARKNNYTLRTIVQALVPHILSYGPITTATLQQFFLEVEKDQELSDKAPIEHLERLKDPAYIKEVYRRLQSKPEEGTDDVESLKVKEAPKCNGVDEKSGDAASLDDD